MWSPELGVLICVTLRLIRSATNTVSGIHGSQVPRRSPRVRRGESSGYLGTRHCLCGGSGGKWVWSRCQAVGSKANFWGRSSARFSDIDFRAASLDARCGLANRLPEISPYYSRVENDGCGQHGPEPGQQPDGNSCHRSSSVVWTTSCKRVRKGSECLISPIAPPS
jgi:hypothetical protein